jgi:hypothetical protein
MYWRIRIRMKTKQVYLYITGELMVYDGKSLQANEYLIMTMYNYGITIDDALSVSELLGSL